MHRRAAENHGFTAAARLDLMDEEGDNDKENESTDQVLFGPSRCFFAAQYYAAGLYSSPICSAAFIRRPFCSL